MTQHRKRLKKLMQSVGIQRNDFQNQLWCMRYYDEWDYETIVNWVRRRQEFQQNEKSLCSIDVEALRKIDDPIAQIFVRQWDEKHRNKW